MNDIPSQRSSDEELTDVERIVSQEGTPQDAGPTDIYTYVADDAAKCASPQRYSHSPAHTTRNSSQNSPLSRNITADSTIGQYAQEINVPPGVRQTTLDSSTFTLPYQQVLNPQSFSSQHGRGLEQSFIGNPQSMPHDLGRMNAVMPSGVPPLEPTAEEYQMQGQTAGPSHIPATQTMAGFGGVSGAMDIAMTDGAYAWWDQSFETFNVDSNQANQMPDGGAYPFEAFSFR